MTASATSTTTLARHSLLPHALGATAVAAAAVAAVLTGQDPADAATSARTAASTCFGQPATIRGTGLLRGTPGDDVIIAGPGPTEVHAGGGDDRICGAFVAYGGPGDDRVALFRAGYREAELRGQAGEDRIYSDVGLAFLYGGQDDDLLVGTAGEQWVAGEGGDDRLVGGRGPDHLVGGTGRDRADGGAGRDSCDAERVRSCEG